MLRQILIFTGRGKIVFIKFKQFNKTLKVLSFIEVAAARFNWNVWSYPKKVGLQIPNNISGFELNLELNSYNRRSMQHQ